MAQPIAKKFVSETELEEQRKKRQEDWEKVRRPDQPVEAPEEVVENRSLYDRLKEQKDKKQEEYDSQRQLKNQVRGLDDDEASFLESVSQMQQDIEDKRLKEDEEILAVLRETVIVKQLPNKNASSSVGTSSERSSTGPKKAAQADILKKLIKRKRKSDDDATTECKRMKSGQDEDSPDEIDENPEKEKRRDSASVDKLNSEQSAVEDEKSGAVARVVGVLPGIGVYTNTSESDDSSDSEIDTDLFPRTVPKEVEKLIRAAAHQH